MPLRDLLQRGRALLTRSPTEDEAAGIAVTSAADCEAIEGLLHETQRRLAVADQRLAILESSNRTAVRAVRRFLQDRERLVAEREAALIQLSIAVGDRQRTMMLNEHLLTALRDSEEARARLEDEKRDLRQQPAGSGTPAVLTVEAGSFTG
ncbi:hypothetical protein ASF53_21500 [Methylobacterium sp. Leaf123]|uniref:hypothetical protein n=1 Tax=Methylobacterium sp. Leaf123 TaxID=1736264 RepID=UPI0006FA938A|nr:hypothetical protein [Methylobacterium sp. Leaf123]KQQ26175.1 hypothetical protein ASF53_21500 [Methylobacterium sp. Leaf123]